MLTTELEFQISSPCAHTRNVIIYRLLIAKNRIENMLQISENPNITFVHGILLQIIPNHHNDCVSSIWFWPFDHPLQTVSYFTYIHTSVFGLLLWCSSSISSRLFRSCCHSTFDFSRPNICFVLHSIHISC